MKNIYFILLLLFIVSCSTTSKYVTVENRKLPSGMVVFLQEFEKAAINRDSGKIIQSLDKEYRDIQLYDFHKGNTEQFLGELFCGNYEKKSGFKCLDHTKIKELKFHKAENNEDGYTVYYKVSDGEHSIICSWLVTVQTSNQKTTYGIYGALG